MNFSMIFKSNHIIFSKSIYENCSVQGDLYAYL